MLHNTGSRKEILNHFPTSTQVTQLILVISSGFAQFPLTTRTKILCGIDRNSRKNVKVDSSCVNLVLVPTLV